MDNRGHIHFAYRQPVKPLLSKRRTWFAEAETPATAETTEGKDTADKGKGKTDATQPNQDELNKKFGEARAEGKKVALSEWAKEHGFENPDDIAKLIKEKKEADEAAKTAEQKTLERIAELEKERDEAKAKREEIEKERLLERRDTKVKESLSDPNFRCKNPAKVFNLLRIEHPAEVEAVLKADGSYDDAALKRLLELGKKENPEYFTGTGPGSPSNAGGKTQNTNQVELKQRIRG